MSNPYDWQEAYDRGVEAERLRAKEIIDSMKIDIIGSCAYQGADFPKKWLKNEVPLMQERNRTLEDLKNKLKEPEKEELK